MDREELREFLHFLDGEDMTEEEKFEYIELIDRIVTEFVWLGFGVHPIQQVMEERNGKPPLFDAELLKSFGWEDLSAEDQEREDDPPPKEDEA
jgi:hypothetical protein